MNCPECGMRMIAVMDAERRNWWVCPRCKIQIPSRVMKNPVFAPNIRPSRHEIGVGFRLFTPFSSPC